MGIDLEDVLPRKTWRWVRIRIQGLLSADTRLARSFQPPPEKPKAR